MGAPLRLDQPTHAWLADRDLFRERNEGGASNNLPLVGEMPGRAEGGAKFATLDGEPANISRRTAARATCS
ncbi:hypothetical protein SAMN03159496_01484 [Rhizobium sp. NFR07]|nr:hypothetical protein SAMN03159496_01484 [Rhizobium sp. NFR07]